MEECLYLYTIYLAIFLGLYLDWKRLDSSRGFLGDLNWPSRLH